MREDIYTVSQVNNRIRDIIDSSTELTNICVKGEISNLKYHNSGHIYFSLKDSDCVIRAVMFRGNRLRGLNFEMNDGDEVLVTGRVGVYPQGGAYQLYATKISRSGTGLLYQKFEKLKEELEEMGLFDPMYKKPLPKYALKIGVCTSSTGAAIQDIRNVISRRNPYASIYLYPSLVQGEGASADIINGIKTLDNMDLDIIIVCRGGGSIEDLWCFNEKSVAQAIFNCNTPVVSGVGHEIDFTIADFVADVRAATPSQAAEISVFEYSEFDNLQNVYFDTLNSLLNKKVQETKADLNNLENQLKIYSPINQLNIKIEKKKNLEEQLTSLMIKLVESNKHKLDNYRQYQDSLELKIKNEMNQKMESIRHTFEINAQKLESLSPLKKISGGFAFVSDENGKNVLSVNDVKKDDDIKLVVADGTIDATVTKTNKEKKYGN